MSQPFTFIHQLTTVFGMPAAGLENDVLEKGKRLYEKTKGDMSQYRYTGILLNARALPLFQGIFNQHVTHLYVWVDDPEYKKTVIQSSVSPIILEGITLDEALTAIGEEVDVLLVEGTADFLARIIEEGYCDEVSLIIPPVIAPVTKTISLFHQTKAYKLAEACLLEEDFLWIRYLLGKN